MIARLKAALEGAQSVALVCHLSPDMDTLGSAVALRYILEAQGKRAVVYDQDEVPERYLFLEGLGLEYRYILWYLTGRIPTLDALQDELGRAIKRFAKRQMVWFKKDRDVLWLDTAVDPLPQAVAATAEFLGRPSQF